MHFSLEMGKDQMSIWKKQRQQLLVLIRKKFQKVYYYCDSLDISKSKSSEEDSSKESEAVPSPKLSKPPVSTSKDEKRTKWNVDAFSRPIPIMAAFPQMGMTSSSPSVTLVAPTQQPMGFPPLNTVSKKIEELKDYEMPQPQPESLPVQQLQERYTYHPNIFSVSPMKLGTPNISPLSS